MCAEGRTKEVRREKEGGWMIGVGAGVSAGVTLAASTIRRFDASTDRAGKKSDGGVDLEDTSNSGVVA